MEIEKSTALGFISLLLLITFSILTLRTGTKVVFIGWAAFLSMLLGSLFSKIQSRSRKGIVWSYGISGGAALASVLFFVMPKAISLSTNLGITGILAGFLTGLTLHSLSHEIFHEHDKGTTTSLSVTLHAIAAGAIIGVIYQQLPAVSIILGLAVVSHKLPAGYMIAHRLKKADKQPWKKILLPASAVGSTALIIFNFPLTLSTSIQALLFGFSVGVFIHVALDFIPEPEPESHIRKVLTQEEDPIHQELDEISIHSVASTITGAALITILALVL